MALLLLGGGCFYSKANSGSGFGGGLARKGFCSMGTSKKLALGVTIGMWRGGGAFIAR